MSSSLKNVGYEKFWPDLEISEAFVIGPKLSFSDDLVSRGLIFFQVLESNFETGVSQSLKVSNLPFYTPKLGILSS